MKNIQFQVMEKKHTLPDEKKIFLSFLHVSSSNSICHINEKKHIIIKNIQFCHINEKKHIVIKNIQFCHINEKYTVPTEYEQKKKKIQFQKKENQMK